MAQETGEVTGTKDKDYNLIWFTEASLSNVLRLETYIEDAEREGDSDLAEFFRRAQATSRKGGEQGKDLLRKRLEELKNEYAQTTTTYGPNHPKVLELSNRMQALDGSIQAELKRLTGGGDGS